MVLHRINICEFYVEGSLSNWEDVLSLSGILTYFWLFGSI